jgi:type VI protein secretion system component VasF
MKSIAYTLWIVAALLGQSQQFPRDPAKEMQKRAEKESSEKNYKELREAATELAELTKQLSTEIDEAGQHVISARVFDRLERIEKLAKRIRDKAKGNSILVPKDH